MIVFESSHTTNRLQLVKDITYKVCDKLKNNEELVSMEEIIKECVVKHTIMYRKWELGEDGDINNDDNIEKLRKSIIGEK